MRVLILGGTGEARTLAARLAAHPELDVVSSLAGRVGRPVLPAGRVRIGGFGGVAGLARYLRAEQVERVVDATHPFATTITEHAVTACAATAVPLLVLRRPGWVEAEGDRWRRVPSTADAAAVVAAGPPGAVLLTLGSQDVGAFAGDAQHSYVVRSVEAPSGPLPPRHVVLLDRGPFGLDGERDLISRYGVSALVSRDSGGWMTAPKLAAARELRVRVVLVDRPAVPTGTRCVQDVEEAEQWLRQPGGRGASRRYWGG